LSIAILALFISFIAIAFFDESVMESIVGRALSIMSWQLIEEVIELSDIEPFDIEPLDIVPLCPHAGAENAMSAAIALQQTIRVINNLPEAELRKPLWTVREANNTQLARTIHLLRPGRAVPCCHGLPLRFGYCSMPWWLDAFPRSAGAISWSGVGFVRRNNFSALRALQD
jgi:hypothetical protein